MVEWLSQHIMHRPFVNCGGASESRGLTFREQDEVEKKEQMESKKKKAKEKKMLNRAIFRAIEENLDYLTKHCSRCDMVEQCEEKAASGDNDYEPRYCKSIIEAAVMNQLNFKIPFPKPKL